MLKEKLEKNYIVVNKEMIQQLFFFFKYLCSILVYFNPIVRTSLNTLCQAAFN